ncbi:putative Monooxygenase FAD-binding protein [Verrucomicrobia bacterium]|nr:putative Monooxygenase FAD-binding protein [Verrucomicrobiota bacterium]
MKERHTEVLVVGAGPVGLLTAVLLAEAGIRVQIIDSEERVTVRSYACALHPRTLELLARLGLAAPLLEFGVRVPKMAFYDGGTRCTQVAFAALSRDFPFLLVVPQSALEGMLEQRLRDKSSVAVNWKHRFDDLQTEDDSAVATLERLGGSAGGYIVPHYDTVVKKRFPLRAQFVVGADGHHSLVRRRLEIEHEYVGRRMAFVACEFSSDPGPQDEVRVVLDENTANVLWPLPANGYRWGFELIHSDKLAEFPEKDREAIPSVERALNEQIRGSIRKLCVHRAPWFSASVKDIGWCKQVIFEPRVAKSFGRQRCWLVGDAAHQTGPVGMQSMNMGLLEAEDLASRLAKILHEEAPLESLEDYDREFRGQWRQLLGITASPKPRNDTNSWARARCARILPCLPGSGEHLSALANQLGLDFP